jgi:hypothetical protein
MTPKAFISYSWSSAKHQGLIRTWAEQLANDGVDVVLDQYDLKEGQDKYAFMERMVTDKSVTHVLVFSDKEYAEKADARKAGVGTESQIISKEIYESVDQSKFIPIVCEFSADDEPYLPTFLKTRIWIDFSTPEAVNENWERLIRHLFGKPLHEKPTLGKPPVYIREDKASPSSPAITKYNLLRQAIIQDKRGVGLYRRDFLDACFEYADSLRVRESPQVDAIGEKILEDCGKLVHVRNHIIDWVLLESEVAPSGEFSEALIGVLERLLDLKSRPIEITSWSNTWFEAHSVFVYETFLYIVASLLKTNSFEDLHNIFTSHYLKPESESQRNDQFASFGAFYGYSQTLNAVLATAGQRLYSPAAELIKRQADREDIPFKSLIEAELLILLMAFINPNADWYPQTLFYAGYTREFQFFVRASQHKNFKKLATITGIEDATALREAVKKGHERLNTKQWQPFGFRVSFWEYLNMDKLDTLQ